MDSVINPSHWVKLYGSMLYGYTLKRVNDREVAEDLVQDTFVAALRAKKNFEERSSERTWLFAILKNKIIDYYRGKGRSQTENIDESDTLDYLFNEKGVWKDSIDLWGSNPDKQVEEKEFSKILKRCIGFLPEVQQRVFTLRDMQSLSGEDICKVLNISSSNLWVLTHRARHQLRSCLTQNWFRGK